MSDPDYRKGDLLVFKIPPCGHLYCHGFMGCTEEANRKMGLPVLHPSPSYSPGDTVRVRAVSAIGYPHKDWKLRSISSSWCNSTMEFAPGIEEIEEALQRGETAIESWSIWRCKKCGLSHAGGFGCQCGWDPYQADPTPTSSPAASSPT